MKLITIATFTYPHEMSLAKSKLEANDIQCVTKDELTVQVHNFYSNAVGGVKLQVLEQDLEAAQEILKETNDLPADYSNETIKCSHCGSGNIEGKRLNGKLSILLWMLTTVPIPIFSSKYHCFDCHQDYRFKSTAKADLT